MKQLTTSSLKQGYITIPRALLNRQATDGAAGETEAFLQILAHTNYSDVPYDINGTIILCKRGDSLISYHHWSNIFGWTRPKTTRFFQRLAKGGIIDLIPHQEKILHIRITNFDLWTGRIPSEAKDARKEEISTDFDRFWDKYHTVMRKPKVNVARGRREWNKLTRERFVRNARCIVTGRIKENRFARSCVFLDQECWCIILSWRFVICTTKLQINRKNMHVDRK